MKPLKKEKNSIDTLQVIKSKKVVPVMVAKNEEQFKKVLKALMQGGLPILEITLRTPYALDAIKLARK